MRMTPCRHCRRPKPVRRYLCLNCWEMLPPVTRRSLGRRDTRALARLRELHRQLDAHLPLPEILVSP